MVDQIGRAGELLHGVDVTLSPTAKRALLLAALPGATLESYAGQHVVRFADHVILGKQVTYLGHPWPVFKKRIQIPREWVDVERQAAAEGLTPHFVGVYHHADVTIFVDFDPSTYVRRRANNSAAHVATNDLYQAQVHGEFTRTDRNGNRLSAVRADQFANYLAGGLTRQDARLDVFQRFNLEFLDGVPLEALDAVRAMHAARWPDTFQGEWPGFYLEFRLDAFLRSRGVSDLVEFQKSKTKGKYDFDLVFRSGGVVVHFGDLKASNIERHDSPGNDAGDFARSLAEYGRFWYVIYEHETHHARDNGNRATVEWNEWRRSVGHRSRKEYDPLSYAQRFKESVRFVKMSVLEVNPANAHMVLGDFRQGKQPDGAARAIKVMINKTDIDNFLIFTDSAPARRAS